MNSLNKLENAVHNCDRCRLGNLAANHIFGEGDPNAAVMIVGESPGREDSSSGRLFSGDVGMLLDKAFIKLSVNRGDFYLANILKCVVGTTRVILADGSSMLIRDMVNSKHPGPVISVNSSGQLVVAPVVGWHRSPLAGRPVVKLTHEFAKGNGNGTVGALLTTDHEVLTSTGWVLAGDIDGHLVATGGISPSKKVRQLIYGSLLGDASIAKAYSYLVEAHTAKQADYVKRKAALLGKMVSALDEWPVCVEGKMHDVIGYRTRGDILFRKLAGEWYHDRIKIVPSYIEHELDWFGVAVWFMDDGHLQIRGGKQPAAGIATNAFSTEDAKILLAALKRLGLVPKYRRKRLYFDVANTAKLCEKIAPFVPPSMSYKLPENFRDRFIPDTWEDSGYWETLYAPASILPAKSDAKTVFCLDVAGTYNFLTPGGIVHNCYSTGSRMSTDIKEECIPECFPFLEEQIGIIKPRSILALGAAAMQTLIDSHSSIGKVRGSAFAGPNEVLVVPTWHPSYLLRAGKDSRSKQRQLSNEFISDLKTALDLAGVAWEEKK